MQCKLLWSMTIFQILSQGYTYWPLCWETQKLSQPLPKHGHRPSQCISKTCSETDTKTTGVDMCSSVPGVAAGCVVVVEPGVCCSSAGRSLLPLSRWGSSHLKHKNTIIHCFNVSASQWATRNRSAVLKRHTNAIRWEGRGTWMAVWQ